MPEIDRLTQDEAEARAALISNPAYRPTIRMAADQSAKTYESEVTVDFDCSTPGASSFIDLLALRVSEATLNGKPVDVSRYKDGRLPLDDLQGHNTLTVKSLHVYSDMGAGLTRVVDSEDGTPYLHTQFEHNHAHKVFACFDQPDIKGTIRWTVEAPKPWTVVTNTAETATTDLGNGMERREYAPTERISTYLGAMVAGPFAKFEDTYTSVDGRVIPMAIYCRASQAKYFAKDSKEFFDITKAGLRAYEEEFGVPYPFPKYDQIIVPGFKAGAMENPGAITFAETVIFRGAVPMRFHEWRAQVILHEMAHMWFGDLVTMKWWQDLWLNESFATFMATRMQDRVTKYKTALVTANADKMSAAVLDQRPTTHAIVTKVSDTDVVHENFDAITYEKGAAALRQLVAYIGDDAFVRGIRRYFRTHAWKNATLDDFLSALEAEAPGKDLKAWAKQWLETPGMNVLRPSFSVGSDGALHDVVIEQTVADNGAPVLRSHVLNVGLYDLDAAGRLKLRRSVQVEVGGARTAIPQLEGERRPALLLVNDGDLTYAKVRLDDRSLDTVVEHLKDAPDPLTRALLWSTVWDMTRDAEMPARRFVELVCRQAPAEKETLVVDAALSRAAVAINSYADPRVRDALREQLAAVARAQLQRSDLDQAQRLTWMDGYLSNATIRDHGKADPADIALLKGMLDGSRSLPGISVDPEMRWKLVIALSGAGALPKRVVDAELAHDNSIQGQRSALQALASRPNSAAKAEAYRMLVDPQPGDPQMTPQNMRALLAGFKRPGQERLIRRYTKDYPALVDRLCRQRTEEEVDELVTGLFPPIGRAALGAATATLSQPHITRSARRTILESADGVRRAQKARRRDRLDGPPSLPGFEQYRGRESA